MDINKKILDLMYHSVIEEGGDGDAVWLSKHTKLADLIPLIVQYNIENRTNWTIENKENYLLWYNNQEGVQITNDVEWYKNQIEKYKYQPSWFTIKIDY